MNINAALRPKGIHSLRQRHREWCDDLEACGDQEQLDVFLESTKGHLSDVERDIPDWFEGGGDVPGIEELIRRKTDSIKQETEHAEYQ